MGKYTNVLVRRSLASLGGARRPVATHSRAPRSAEFGPTAPSLETSPLERQMRSTLSSALASTGLVPRSRRSAMRYRAGGATGGDSQYMANHFLIELTSADPYIRDNGLHDDDYYHAFIHEYWHYLQNVTTVAGLRSFSLTQILAYEFIQTLNGRESQGSAALDSGTRKLIPGIVELYYGFGGDLGPGADWSKDVVSFEVVRIDEDDLKLDLGKAPPGSPPNPKNPIIIISVKATDVSGVVHEGSFTLGSIAIEESIACIVEEEIQSQTGARSEDGPLPQFPYRIVEAILKHLMKGGQSFRNFRYYSAALGTLALLSLYPGEAFIHVGRRFCRALEEGVSEDEALRLVADDFLRDFEERVKKIERIDLTNIVKKCQGRGLWEDAAKYLCRLISRGLNRRAADPFFDINAVFFGPERQKILSLMEDFPPCDVAQEHPNGRRTIYRMDTTPVEEGQFSSSDYTKILQAQQHFVFSHLCPGDAEFVDSQSIINDRERMHALDSCCPFFHACPLEFRRNNILVCRRTPWLAYKGASVGCWYSVSVLGAVGLVTITRAPVVVASHVSAVEKPTERRRGDRKGRHKGGKSKRDFDPRVGAGKRFFDDDDDDL